MKWAQTLLVFMLKEVIVKIEQHIKEQRKRIIITLKMLK